MFLQKDNDNNMFGAYDQCGIFKGELKQKRDSYLELERDNGNVWESVKWGLEDFSRSQDIKKIKRNGLKNWCNNMELFDRKSANIRATKDSHFYSVIAH